MRIDVRIIIRMTFQLINVYFPAPINANNPKMTRLHTLMPPNERESWDSRSAHHDLRHTVGMRLREAGVREETIADILWHTRQGMTAHYSVVQIDELVEALNRITDEGSRINRSLAMIRWEQLGNESPRKVPVERKMG